MTSVDVVEVVTGTVEGLSHDEARRLTDEAKIEAHELAEHLLTLYERGAHIALDYTAWKDYVSEEFGVGLADASRHLNLARVSRALVDPNWDLPMPSESTAARVLGRVLPALDRPADAPSDWTADDHAVHATVVEAWRVAIDQADGEVPTAREAKQALMRAGYIADTRGASGTPSWGEAIGQVGDDLIKARKSMDKFEQLIGEKQPVKHVREKAERYAAWADDLSARLRAVQES